LTWALVMSWETGVSAGMSNATAEVERQMAPMARNDGRRIMVHGGCAVQWLWVGRVVRSGTEGKEEQVVVVVMELFSGSRVWIAVDKARWL
jgi:hypothetical protein